MPLGKNEVTIRSENYGGITTPTSVLRKWKQSKIQELKSRIFATKQSIKDAELQISKLQQSKEDLEFGRKPDLEGHVEMMELELEELKTTIDV